MAWQTESNRVHPQFRAALRRTARRRTVRSEQLEPKLLLGSLVPTQSGTVAGGLLPIETADLLTARQGQFSDATDLSLRNYEVAVDAVRATLQRIETVQPELNNYLSPAEAESLALALEAGLEAAEAESTGQDDSEANPPAPDDVAQAIEQAEQMALLGADIEGSRIDRQPESDPDRSPTGSDDDSDGDEEADDEESAARDGGISSVESEEALRRMFESLSGNDSGRSLSQAVDLTFATGSGPVDPALAQLAGSLASAVSGGAAGSGAAVGLSMGISDGGAATGETTSSTGAVDAAGTNIPVTIDSPASSTGSGAVSPPHQLPPQNAAEPVVIRYDFRDFAGYRNEITPAEQAAAQDAFMNWRAATGNQLQFERDTQGADPDVVIIYKGPLEAAGFESGPGEVLGLGGSVEVDLPDGTRHLQRVVLVDHAETLDVVTGNGNPAGTFDFGTIVGHEIGHVLGIGDSAVPGDRDIMNGVYDVERGPEAYVAAADAYGVAALRDVASDAPAVAGLQTMITGFPQLSAAEVDQILEYATTVSPSDDAIIAVVDRGGRILGVRVEDGVIANFDNPTNPTTAGNGNGVIDAGTAEENTLVFAIDGALAKARTAAFFANGDPDNGTFAPITSRLVRFISQSTITFREVNSNPNSLDPVERGPGLVAPIGVGGHFPPEVRFTPPVDLFHIETTNRDSLLHAGSDGIKGTVDDILLDNRFNIDVAHVPLDTDGDGINDNPDVNMDGVADRLRIDAPESYGFVSGRLPTAQARGIATLPGGVPIYRDTDADGIGDTIIGGIGVFFPGDDGTALFEQGYQPGQTELERTNAPRALEAEFIAVVAAGGSAGADAQASGAKPGNHPVPDLDIPFGRLDLVGIQLQVIGRTAGIRGVQQLLRDVPGILVDQGLNPADILAPGNLNGENQVVNGGGDLTIGGASVPHGWLVTPHDGGDFDGVPGPDITAAEVEQIINQGIAQAEDVRAAIRLPLGSRTRMVFAVADESGEVLGLYRMPDATVFSIEVAVSKARNTAYYASVADLQPVDQAVGQDGNIVPAGTAFTNRTFRFLAEPRFPSGQDGTIPGGFSILHDIVDAVPGFSFDVTAQQIVESDFPIPYTEFDTVLGFHSFNPGSNFRDVDNVENQSGVVFFPGSSPLYGTNGALIGGFGVSGDGVDQDDVVTFVGAGTFLPPDAVVEADEVFVDGIRLPYQKFLRNPEG